MQSAEARAIRYMLKTAEPANANATRGVGALMHIYTYTLLYIAI